MKKRQTIRHKTLTEEEKISPKDNQTRFDRNCDRQEKKAQRQSSVTGSVTLAKVLNSQGDIYH